ncbi:Syntaxin 16 [Blattamonas nauphoetae]|uniref:Syntaxin 16 n=1 Tax=Blattamonas nauphoetae TaxID=2049346 RepID=A0ABQ9XQ72_9EUKA|nr:Syntaxin 16 [Blattamonas nauphoetae]
MTTEGDLPQNDDLNESVDRMIRNVRELSKTSTRINDVVVEQNSILDSIKNQMDTASSAIKTAGSRLVDLVKENPKKAMKITIAFAIVMILLIWLFFFKLGY